MVTAKIGKVSDVNAIAQAAVAIAGANDLALTMRQKRIVAKSKDPPSAVVGFMATKLAYQINLTLVAARNAEECDGFPCWLHGEMTKEHSSTLVASNTPPPHRDSARGY